MLLALRAVAITLLAALAVALGGGFVGAQAAAPDCTPSPVGQVIGGVVIFSSAGTALSPAGAALPGLLMVSPTPVGSLVIPMQIPVGSGTGLAMTQLQVVIPGPNPAQNTPVALSQLLTMTLRSAQPGPAAASAPVVGVLATPSH